MDGYGLLLLMPVMMVLECAMAAIQENLWDTVKARTDTLENAFNSTGLFRKFV